jgi:hypothetical protein
VLAAGAWAVSRSRLIWGGLVGCLALVLFDLITLHPYQTCYFNRLLAGGLAQAGKKFDTDYWGQSYQAGAQWILEKYPTQTMRIGVPFMAKRLEYYFDRPQAIQERRERLLSAWRGEFTMPPRGELRLQPVGPDWHQDYFARGDYELWMANSQVRITEETPEPPLFTVERQGVRLLTIKQTPKDTRSIP